MSLDECFFRFNYINLNRNIPSSFTYHRAILDEIKKEWRITSHRDNKRAPSLTFNIEPVIGVANMQITKAYIQEKFTLGIALF